MVKEFRLVWLNWFILLLQYLLSSQSLAVSHYFQVVKSYLQRVDDQAFQVISILHLSNPQFDQMLMWLIHSVVGQILRLS
jgi:hypothetical protein